MHKHFDLECDSEEKALFKHPVRKVCYGCGGYLSTLNNRACEITGFRIVWGDGSPDTRGSGRSDYVSHSFSHEYSSFGTFKPYVKITRLDYECLFIKKEKTETKDLATVINRPSIVPVIQNLLLV